MRCVSAFLFLFLLSLFLPAQAEAFIWYHHGEDITPVGEVAAEHKEVVRAEIGTDAAVGFIHSEFGVLWLDVWTWNGRYCLFKDDQYWELDDERAAMFLNKSAGELSKPFMYSFPPGLLLLLGGGLVAVPYAIYSKSRDEKIRQETTMSFPPT